MTETLSFRELHSPTEYNDFDAASDPCASTSAWMTFEDDFSDDADADCDAIGTKVGR